MKLTQLIIIGSVLISNSLLFVYGEESPSVEFNFSSDACKMSSFLKESERGVQKVNWQNNNKLEIKVFDNLNCADWIEGGDFKIHDNTIVLKYIIGYSIRDGERVSANCICPYELNYIFTNLEKKDYRFELEVEGRAGTNPKINKEK